MAWIQKPKVLKIWFKCDKTLKYHYVLNVEAVILKFESFSSMENECVPLNRLTVGDLLIKILVLLVHGQYSLTAVRALCYGHEGSNHPTVLNPTVICSRFLIG